MAIGVFVDLFQHNTILSCFIQFILFSQIFLRKSKNLHVDISSQVLTLLSLILIFFARRQKPQGLFIALFTAKNGELLDSQISSKCSEDFLYSLVLSMHMLLSFLIVINGEISRTID